MKWAAGGLLSLMAAACFAAPPDRCPEPPYDRAAGDGSPAAMQQAIKDAPPIARALGRGRQAHLVRMLANGADPNVCVGGVSVLGLSAVSGDLEEVRMRLDGGALPDRPLDSGGGTPLLAALQAGHCDVAALLLDRGANPLHTTDGGTSALHELAMAPAPMDEPGQRQQQACAERLLRQGIAVDVRNRRGATPLMLATARRNRGMAEFLLAHGAHPDARDSHGNSALAMARLHADADWLAMFERAMH